MEELLSLFYDSDEAVKNDGEIQNWVRDAVENGFREMPNFGLPSELTTRRELFELCSRLIGQVSIGHATFGFLVPWSKLITIFSIGGKESPLVSYFPEKTSVNASVYEFIKIGLLKKNL